MLEVFSALAIFLLLALTFRQIIKIKNKDYKKKADEYFELERQANMARKKTIDEDLYYEPDMEKLPIKEYSPNDEQNSKLLKAQELVFRKSKLKMIKFNSYKSNMELKMEYGFANLEHIATYEENFNEFMSALTNWGEQLINQNNLDDGELVLQFAIKNGCDLSKTFILLADMYYNKNSKEKLNELYELVWNLELTSKSKIASYIKSKMDFNE